MQITDPLQARVFQNSFQRQLLLSCVKRAESMKALAAFHQKAMTKVHYNVGCLLKAGLLEVEETKARAGRAVKYYRAVAEGFIVPDMLVTDFNASLRHDFVEALVDARLRGDGATLFTLHEKGGFQMKRLENSRADTHEIWAYMALERNDLEAMNSEIMDVITRYRQKAVMLQKSGKRTKRYLVHHAFAPVQN